MKTLNLLSGMLLAAVAPCVAAAAPELVQTRAVQSLTSSCCGDVTLNIQNAGGAANNYYVNSWGQSSASVDALSAQYGLLGGTVSAGTQRSHPSYNASGGTAQIRDAWSDAFTITSSTLAVGTAVQLQLSVTVDGAFKALNPDGVSNDAEGGGRMAAAFHFGGWDAPGLTGVDVKWGRYVGTQYGFGTLSGSFANQAVIETHVGDTVNLVGDLLLWYGQNSGPAATAWYDGYTAGNARFSVDVLTAGAAYSTASGQSYITPVPEPEAYALFLAGLGLVGWAARRRG